MNHSRQAVTSIVLSVVIVLFGCVGYILLEDWAFMDALYMTIITLATVGYGEVHPVSPEGRIFTMLLIVLGGGYFLYVMGYIIQFLVEGRIRIILGRRKLDTQINKLKGHYIVCGYGRIGRVLTRYLIQKYVDVVVIEKNPDRTEKMDDDGILYLVGEATDEGMLERAGIHRAKGLVTVVATDADNVFLVLTAKQLNTNLFVVARASQNSSKKTLLAAGADKVISPYDLGARRMAHAILRPTVIKFLEMAFADDNTDIQVEQMVVKETSKLVGKSLLDAAVRQEFDLIIIAIEKGNGEMIFNPKADTIFHAQDTLVVVGQARSLKRLERLL